MTEQPPAVPNHPVIAGVTLAQYATVLSGLEDELEREAVLSYAVVPAEQWDGIHDAWQRAVLDDLESGGDLAERLAEAMAAALLCWSRPLPPVDQDLRGWLDLLRAWSDELEPEAFLAEQGMRPCDMSRLHALWHRRIQADPAVRARAAAVLDEPPGAVPDIHPEPATLASGAPAMHGGPPP